MSDLVVRPLVAGEESLFDSMPDPLPELRRMPYADGVAGGGYRPERTFVAILDGAVVGRAAWLLIPGATGEPWLEHFDLTAEPSVGAELLDAAHAALGGPKTYYAAAPAHWRRRPELRAVLAAPMAAAELAGLVEYGERHRYSWAGGTLPLDSGRYEFRAATGTDEIEELVARIAEPEVLTGRETALGMAGVDLAADPLAWLHSKPEEWVVALDSGVPVGIAGTAVQACYPLLAYLGVLDETVRPELIAAGVRASGDVREVIADVDAHRVAVVGDLERTGFRQLRSRVEFRPADGVDIKS